MEMTEEWEKCISDIMQYEIDMKQEVKKSSIQAQKFRQDGNRLYASSQKSKNYETAYAYYAQSIAHAPANSQELPLAYSNLSAVLFKLKKYYECLQAIDCCLNSGYPEGSKFKIQLRKIECLKIVDKHLEATKAYEETLVWIEQNQPEEVQKAELKKQLKDCYNKQVEVKKRITKEEVDQILQDFSIKSFNSEIQGASSAIELKYRGSLGRHFVATRDIRPGEILLRERPFLLVGSKNSRYNCCWKCLQSLTNCIPCDRCVNVIFCSVECKEKAWEKFHDEECKLLSPYMVIPESDFATVILAIRMLILGIKEYGSLKKLNKVVKEMNQRSSDPRTRGFTNGQLLHNCRAIYSLKTFVVLDDIFMSSLATTFLILPMATKTALLGTQFEDACSEDVSAWVSDSEELPIAGSLITGHMDIAKTNGFETSQFSSSDYSGKFVSVLGSMFNHSCVANAHYNIANPYAEAFAILPIKKGEQIFLNYLGDTFYKKDERQEIFQTKYNFTCKCVACKNAWPEPKLYPALKESKICDKNHNEMETDMEQLSGIIKELVKDVSQPCKDLWVLQNKLIHLFVKLRQSYYI